MNKKFKVVGIILIGVLALIGWLSFYDYQLDRVRTEATQETVKVVGKARSKHSRKLIVKYNGHRKRIRVDKSTYANINRGDFVQVYALNGKVGYSQSGLAESLALGEFMLPLSLLFVVMITGKSKKI